MGDNKKNKNTANVSAMKQIFPLLITAIAAVVISIGGLYLYQTGTAQQRLEQKQASALARLVARQVQASINDARAQLALLAERADVAQALADQTLSQFNASGHQWQPDASVVLVPRHGTDTSQFSYSAQELLKEVRQGKQPAPVIIAGQPPQLVIAQASKRGNGTLLLTRSLASLANLLPASLPDGAQLQLQYRGSRLFATAQQANGISSTASAGAVSATLTLPAADTPLLLPATLAAALAVVALLAATLVVNRLLSRALRQDAAEMIRYSDELIRHPNVTARNHFHFALFQSVTAAMAKSAAKLRARGSAPIKRQPDIAAMEVEEDVDDSILLTDNQQVASLPEEVFRAYDIRGVAGVTLTAQTAYLLGRAIGTEACDAGQQTVLVARDGRLSSPELTRSLIKGLMESGRDVINLGLMPSPLLYYATEVLETRTGIVVTGSHNPASHNGMKIIINGETLYGDRIQGLRQRIDNADFSEGQGKEEQRDISDRYLNDMVNDIVLARPLRIAIDCGNGATGELAPRLFSQLGCDVTPLYTDIDGNFPNHAPDPGNPDNLQDLIRIVQQQQLDLGLAFDGDGDRLAVVTNRGEVIWPDRLLMLFAKDLLSRTPGADILFDVKCTRALPAIIRKSGGRPMMYKTGHSLIKAKMKESGAPLAGEISGHIFFADRWFGCDDGLYAGCRLLEILSLMDEPASQVFAALKTGITTPALYIDVEETRKFALVDALSARAEQFAGGRPTTIDGLRVDFPDGWGLVRASNTTASLVARFEGRDEDALERVKTLFRNQLKAVDENLSVPF